MTAPDRARLAAVAAWDVPLVRGAVATLDAVAARLRTWRARLDGVGRSLSSGESWTGPAARSAVAVVDELSAAAWAADTAVAESLAALERLAREVDAAQDVAVEALAADAVPDLVQALEPGRAATAAAAALRHATAAGAAARDAWAATDRLGILRAIGPADLGDLAAAGTARGTDPPLDRPPGEVALWWASLSAAAQAAAIDRVPAVLGRLDGLPGWARDRANRRALASVLADPRTAEPAAETARALAARIRDEEAAGRTVQLHLLDLDGDRVALSIGDLDTAEAVAVLVPGVGTTPLDDLGRLTGDARDLASSGRTVAPGVSVATVVWLGYRTPGSPRTMTSRASAWQGGPALAAALAGLDAARAASGQPAARTSVLAHSYGTVVVDEAADAPGALAADAVVLLGSPGMEDTAAGLEVPEVYDATSAADPVTWPGWFGSAPRAGHFGSTALPVEPGTGHSEYYVPHSATLTALAEVVTGSRGPA